MNRASRLRFFVSLVGPFAAVAASAAPLVPAPPFAGASLPAPPQPSRPWVPPAGLPAPLVSAATTLFAEGLADPRGGEYRQVSVGVGSVWSGDGGVMRTHAWVLPPAAGPRFAVCWNGLVYPLVSVGDPADLSADVLALVKTDADTRAAHDKANPAEPYSRFMRGAIPESQSVSETSLLPIKAALLVRLGEGDLAHKYWDAWLGGTPHYNNSDKSSGDPYLTLADEWVWALFDRAVTAHMRGDDRLSLLSARQLAALQPVAEAEAARRGYPHRPDSEERGREQPYFPYLGPLPRLLADEERRVADARTPRPALAAILAMPDKGARIAALIRALDQVSARQDSQPGSVSPDADPIVMGLIAQGDAAVQPLIDALAGDPRLTRSVGFGRALFQDRYPVSVAGAAHAALVDILHTSEFSAAPEASLDRAGAAVALQAYWNKYKGVSAPERWYRTLADDKAATGQWLDAAHEITRPGNEVAQGGWLVTLPTPAGAVVPLHGEGLRHGHTPSVSALMARRVGDIVTLSEAQSGDSRQFNDVEDATAMALRLAAWDPAAARPILQGQFGTERGALDHWRHGIDVTSDSLSLTKLTLARVHSRDPAALSDYMDWLKVTPLVDFPIFSLSNILEPLWRSPDDPAVVRGAAFLFNDPGSPWVPLVQERPGGLYTGAFENLVESPLLGVAGFRRAALAALADRAVLQTKPAPVVPVRRCDLYAWHLSRLDGMPAFQYDWPLARRDAAVAAAAARLRRYGPRFGAGHPVLRPGETWSGGPNDIAFLRFPRLGHPATAADVARNRAIFTLGAGARAVGLPQSPLPARWVTDRRYPRDVRVWSAARKKYEPAVGYFQDGNVWQAEETAAGKRFYGFVGPHDVARVPAEEIEFPPADSYTWTQVSGGLDCELAGTPGDPLAPPTSLPAAGPITLRLRSRSGLAQSVPADFLRKRLTLTLLFSADDRAAPADFRDPSRVWEAVPPRRAPLLPPARALRLMPAQEEATWTLDPRDWFDLSRPGTYRLSFAFAGRPTGSGAPSPEAAFRVAR